MLFSSPKTIKLSILLLITVCFLNSCKKETETPDIESIAAYASLDVGRSFIYRVDSLLYPGFGYQAEIREYEVKHVVDALLTNNSGNPFYRIYKYIRNADQSNEYTANGTYTATIVNNRLEIEEDNLRFINMASPISETTVWKGNSYLPAAPYKPFGYTFNNDNANNLNNWNFEYHQESHFAYGGQEYNNLWKITHQDESINAPVTDTRSYAFKSFSLERYSKNVGLVYREKEIWEYQPNLNDASRSYYNGFGIKMWLIAVE